MCEKLLGSSFYQQKVMEEKWTTYKYVNFLKSSSYFKAASLSLLCYLFHYTHIILQFCFTPSKCNRQGLATRYSNCWSFL